MKIDKFDYNHIEFDPVWEDEYKYMPYIRKPYNDLLTLSKWKNMGFTHENFTGEMCNDQNLIFDWAKNLGKILNWKNCGYTFYRMKTGDIMPPHRDHFSNYKKMFNIKNTEDVMRCVVFLENKKTGHMFEIDGIGIGDWMAGGAIVWRGSVEHTALNVGSEPRYTLQITGHLNHA